MRWRLLRFLENWVEIILKTRCGQKTIIYSNFKATGRPAFSKMGLLWKMQKKTQKGRIMAKKKHKKGAFWQKKAKKGQLLEKKTQKGRILAKKAQKERILTK